MYSVRDMQEYMSGGGDKGRVIMRRVIIDNREVEVADGATVLDAARKLGIEIPTMCFLKGQKPLTSCMVCVVKVAGSEKLIPACGAIAEDGMRIETDNEEVRQARRAALELLLSEHVGDCVGPCQVTCPAQMDIPLMIGQIAAGRLGEAIATVKRDIALPAVLGRICPAPCEAGASLRCVVRLPVRVVRERVAAAAPDRRRVPRDRNRVAQLPAPAGAALGGDQ